MKVKIQIKKNQPWEKIKGVEHNFKNWEEVRDFAHKLAIQVNAEIRVEDDGGNGDYFSPINALNHLNR
jgi:hypothetical protein